MMKRNTAGALGAFAALAMLSFGCSTPRTKVTEQWKDPTHAAAAGKMRHIAVIAQNMPGSMGKSLETEFVDELEDEEVDAVAGHKIFGDNVPVGSALRPALTEKGFDGALFISVADVDQRVASAPPMQYYYYAPAAGAPGTPFDSPRVMAQYTVHVDAGLWDLRDGKRVWGSRTEVENSRNKDFANRTSKKVVNELSKQGLLEPTQR